MNAELLHISFRLMTEKTFSHSMESSLLISDVKALIEPDSEIAPENQRLIFKGQLLKDEFTLKSYGVESGSTIHVVGRALKPLEPEPSDNTQSGTVNENESEVMDGVGSEGQATGPRGTGVPMGVFMSPIYATISVSTPVNPNATENSMEQVATQFFSGVVNSLLTSFNSSSTATNTQNTSTPQNNLHQDELVSELESSRKILKRVTDSIKLLNEQNTETADASTTSVSNDVTITAVANVIATSDASNPVLINPENAANMYNNRDVTHAENVQNSQVVNSINLQLNGSNILQEINTNALQLNPNILMGVNSNVNNLHTTDTVNTQNSNTNISQFKKRSNSEEIKTSNTLRYGDGSNSYNANDETLNEEDETNLHKTQMTKRSNSAPIEFDNLTIKYSDSNELGTEDINEISTSYQGKKLEQNNECDEFEPRRGKVRLMDPELITSKLPWDSLYKLEQHVYELNYGFKLNYSDSVSFSNGGNGSSRGPFIRRPSFTRIELSSPCYLSDEPLSFKPLRSASKNMEQQKRLIEADEPANLDEFLSRLETVNARLSETMNRYDSGDRKTQIEMFKQLSITMSIQTRIYASLCSIFSWMHTQMVSPEIARRFAARMGWSGSGATTPLLQNNARNTQGNFAFAAYSTYVTRDQPSSTDDSQANNANNTHSTLNDNETKTKVTDNSNSTAESNRTSFVNGSSNTDELIDLTTSANSNINTRTEDVNQINDSEAISKEDKLDENKHQER